MDYQKNESYYRGYGNGYRAGYDAGQEVLINNMIRRLLPADEIAAISGKAKEYIENQERIVSEESMHVSKI